MKSYAIYNASGEIRAVLSVSDVIMAEANCGVGESILEVDSPDPVLVTDYWVDDGVLTSRPDMGVTVSSDSITTAETVEFTDVPAGAVLQHPDGEDTVEDGEISWGSTMDGKYRLKLVCFPYKEVEVYVQVNFA